MRILTCLKMVDSQTENVQLYRLVSNIESEDRKKRKEALDEILDLLFYKKDCESICLENISNEIQKNLFKSLYDPSEAVRNSAINLLNEIVQKLEINDQFLSELISILLWRMGENEVNEPSEEIRLRMITLMNDIIFKVKERIASFASDIVQILTKTLADSFPKVRQESCKCAGNLASTVPRHFYDHSNKLITPILASFNHQHFRMRVAAIDALGKVVKYGNTKYLPSQEVFGSLAERLFDSNPTVRSAVTKVIGDWLINLYDRYSFFSKMIPLILTSLCDELPELREEAWNLWSTAGLQYEQENEQDLKDKMDFLNEKPDHYPKNVLRPNLGCRTLVQRNTCQITPALSRELQDWKNDIRIKSAQLLCWLVLHAETDITQHTENLFITMYKVCNQTDIKIVENVEKAAEYIAYFVAPDTYMKLILPAIEDVCSAGHLCVLAALLRGTKSEFLEPHLPSISKIISCDNICRNRNVNYQFQLLKCCESLLNSEIKNISDVSGHLFVILVTIKATSSQHQATDFAGDLLTKLTAQCKNDEITMYENHLGLLFKKMYATVETWTPASFDHQILNFILETGVGIKPHLDDIIAILKIALKPDADAILRSKFFTSLSTVLCRKHLITIIPNPDTYETFIKSLIQDCICPNLIWHAGRAAEALRSVVLACLCAVLLSRKELTILFNDVPYDNSNMEESRGLECFSKETIEDIFNNLFPLLVNSVEDSAVKSRFFSLKIIQTLLIFVQKNEILSPDHVNQLYPTLLKRLDDVSDDVRKEAIKTISALFANLPTSYNPQGFQPHLESLFGTMLIHLDDPDPNFQELMMDALKTVGNVTPKVLYDKLNAIKNRFRNFGMCNEILKYLKDCFDV